MIPPKAGCQRSFDVFISHDLLVIVRWQEQCTDPMLLAHPLPARQVPELGSGVTGQGAAWQSSCLSLQAHVLSAQSSDVWCPHPPP